MIYDVTKAIARGSSESAELNIWIQFWVSGSFSEVILLSFRLNNEEMICEQI